jgi:S-adenosylmethionine:tRNA ribosyltransferase-isomerase
MSGIVAERDAQPCSRRTLAVPDRRRASFTPELVTRLVSRGVGITPLLLHRRRKSRATNRHPTLARVPRHTAERVRGRRGGYRVVAVGTTVVRALETVTDETGMTVPGEGWTGLVVTADRPLRSVTGLISGFHEPRATHLSLLERVAGARHLERAYAEARRLGYLWHEFGDSHLILAAPSR